MRGSARICSLVWPSNEDASNPSRLSSSRWRIICRSMASWVLDWPRVGSVGTVDPASAGGRRAMPHTTSPSDATATRAMARVTEIPRNAVPGPAPYGRASPRASSRSAECSSNPSAAVLVGMMLTRRSTGAARHARRRGVPLQPHRTRVLFRESDTSGGPCITSRASASSTHARSSLISPPHWTPHVVVRARTRDGVSRGRTKRWRWPARRFRLRPEG